jgi:hypothetical protein
MSVNCGDSVTPFWRGKPNRPARVCPVARLSHKEAARLLSLSPWEVRKLCRRGLLAYRKLSKNQLARHNSEHQEIRRRALSRIESEMLTYRALESNSEAVACDIAGYLRDGTAEFSNPPAGTVCTISGDQNSGHSRVIVASFDQSAFNDYQLWRADMGIMRELEMRAENFSCAAGSPIAGSGKGAGVIEPAGSALSLAQTALGLLSSESSVTPVGGTIQDQAFMDGVARELRSLKISVLMPSTFVPYSFAPLHPSHSPFLLNAQKVYAARRCLISQAAKNDASITELVNDIDTFLASSSLSALTEATAATGSSKPSEVSQAGLQAFVSSRSHLIAVLSADSLAQKLGVDPVTGLLRDNGASLHILMLKALESGGVVEKRTNILGSKIRYSGGAIGTYALFDMGGELECSGNVYEYGGALRAKDFRKELRNYVRDPGKQFVFIRGTCHNP